MSKKVSQLLQANTASSNDLAYIVQGGVSKSVTIGQLLAASPLPKWHAALARVRAGTGNARWMMVGDSTTKGHGALGFPNSGNYNYAPAAYLSRMLNALSASGINSHFNSTYGVQTSDSRVVATGAFSSESGGNSLGGSLYRADTTGQLSFTPTVNVDTFYIYYYRASGLGSFSYNVNGGTATTVSANGITGMVSVAVNATLGTNTININWISGNAFICGFWAYDSSKKWVQVDNGGFEGSTTTLWVGTTNAYDPMAASVALVPDLISICLGINDWDGGINLATYTANLQTLITAAKTTSDVILITPNPSNPGAVAGTPATAVQQTYATAMQGLAASNAIPLVDNFSRMGTYASSNAYGMNFDGLHPNSVGYADIAQSIFNTVKPA